MRNADANARRRLLLCVLRVSGRIIPPRGGRRKVARAQPLKRPHHQTLRIRRGLITRVSLLRPASGALGRVAAGAADGDEHRDQEPPMH